MKQETSKKSAKNNIIEDWLKEHGDPKIDKKVECKLEQITLEETAEKYVHINYPNYIQPLEKAAAIEDFIAGAKWQAERMYSKEEIKEAYWNRTDEMDVDGYWISDPEKDLEGLLKELKKIPMTFVPDERMYSEEEVYSLLCSMPNFYNMTIPQQVKARDKWFEQFKKK